MAKEPTKRIKLNIRSHAIGAVGGPGDVVDAPQELADRWLACGMASPPDAGDEPKKRGPGRPKKVADADVMLEME